MKSDGFNLVLLTAAAAACGVPVALAACFAPSGTWCAAYVLAGSVLTALAAAAMIDVAWKRSRSSLCAREVAVPRSLLPNPFRGLIHEALQEVRDLRDAADEARRRRTESEARLHVARTRVRRLEGALDGLSEPVLITDGKDEALFANGAARRLFVPANEPAGAVPVDRVPHAVRSLVQRTRTRSVAADHRSTEFELTVDGRVRTYRGTAFAVVDDDRVLAVCTVLRDVGDEHLERARHAEFVSSATHELKTPLSGIRAFAEMLADGDTGDAEEVRELSGFILVQVDRLTAMIESMLNLARIESGVIEVNREDCELNDVVRSAIEVVRPMAGEKGVRLNEELSELYLAVHPDRTLLGQAFVNLLSNAVKYTPSGGRVDVVTRMGDGSALVEVRDTGMGIPAESLPRLFERFYRVPRNNEAAAGTGLGLALVHDVVTELHGGTIDVESVVDEGTCFTVSIPSGHRSTASRKLVEAAGPA